MFYYLFEWLQKSYGLIGARLFQYISFRAIMATILSLFISIIIGKKVIAFLRKKQIGENIRELGFAGENSKKGTPTMGGIIIIMSILIPTLLFAKLHNVYIILILVCMLGLGFVGFVDDYIKVFKKNKEGLAGRFKLMGQLVIGAIVGTTLYFNSNVAIYREVNTTQVMQMPSEHQVSDSFRVIDGHRFMLSKSVSTTIPFVKNHEFSYSSINRWFGDYNDEFTWVVYVLVVIFIIMAVSNGANLTDGLDGLAAGTSAIVCSCLGVFAYLSGNYIFSNYLNIMFIPNLGELSVFIGALVGACVGFLWYNAYPAKVFMGDTGSLMLGGVIAALAIIVRKELLIPVFCAIFLIENLSVIIQVAYFKYTKKKYGEGRRVFLMSPLHHHFQKKGIHENVIVIRFWIVAIFFAVISILTLKLR